MTKSEAKARLGLSRGSVTVDAIHQAHLKENMRLVLLLQFTPPGTTKAQVMQDIALLDEARDTLVGQGSSSPSSPPAAQPRRPQRSSPRRPQPRPAPSQPGMTNPVRGTVSPPRAPTGPVRPGNRSPRVTRAQRRTRLAQAIRFSIAWLAKRYNRKSLIQFGSDLWTLLRSSHQQWRAVVQADWRNTSLPRVRRVFRTAGVSVGALLNVTGRLADFMVSSWIGAPIVAATLFVIVPLFVQPEDNGKAFYKMYSFPPSNVYLNGELIVQAPSNEIFVTPSGRHTVRFTTGEGRSVKADFDFERNRFYIFHADVTAQTLERKESDEKPLIE